MNQPRLKSAGRRITATALDSWVGTVGAVVLATLGAVLLLPLHSFVTGPAVALWAISAIFLRLHRRQRHLPAYVYLRMEHRRWKFAALAMAAAASSWALFSPFFTSSITYAYRESPAHPLRSRVVALTEDSDLLVVADPVRSLVLTGLQVLSFTKERVRLVPTATIQGREVAFVPIALESIRVRSSEFGPAGSTLKLLAWGRAFSASVSEESDPWGEGNALIGAALYVRDLVDLTAPLTYKTEPWAAVRLEGAEAAGVASYVAVLDLAIRDLTSGRIENALDQLHRAQALAPSELEAARCLTLLAIASNLRLGGNLGRLQSLSYLHSAVDNLLSLSTTRGELTFDRYNQVAKWLSWRISVLVGNWHPVLADLERTTRSEFDFYEYKETTDDQTELSSEATAFFKDFLELVDEKLSSDRGASDGAVAIAQTLVDVLRLQSLGDSRSVSLSSEDLAKLQLSDPFVPDMLEVFGREWSSISSAEEDLLVEHLLQSAGFPRSASLISLSEGDFELAEYHYTLPPNCDWWEDEFLDWFGETMMLMETGLAYNHSLNNLTHDHRGSGRLFVPGLAYLFFRLSGSLNDSTPERFRVMLQRMGEDLEPRTRAPLDELLFGVEAKPLDSAEELQELAKRTGVGAPNR